MQVSNGYLEDNLLKKPIRKDELIANLKRQAKVGAITLAELNMSSDFKLEQLFKNNKNQIEVSNKVPRI